ncbi:MAG: DUF814 domain-containing protein [Gemmatimonadetes bacterium]|nr:DUF814 domain-containing protein [Gemmatimonadota bacterium]
MSNSLIYDPLLVRYLSRELDERLRGRACAAALVFTGERRALLPFDRREALLLDLHPSRGWVRLIRWDGPEELEAECRGVTAPDDERLLRVSFRLPDRFRAEERELIVELQTNQWNAVMVGEEARILAVAWSRSAGVRSLRTGGTYESPAPAARFGVGAVSEGAAWARWREVMEDLPIPARRSALLANFAYTGSPNADFLLGSRDPEAPGADVRSAFERWWWLRSLPSAQPVLLDLGRRVLPYPIGLPGVPGEPVRSLLEGMERLAASWDTDVVAVAVEEVSARVRGKRATVARRVARLEEELTGSEEADSLRASADLLLAKLHEVPRGVDVVRLEDWEEGEVLIQLDPALSATENAGRLYDEARRRERAAARVAQLLEVARAELESWDAALLEAEGGTLPSWAERELAKPERATGGGDAGAEPTRPYRVYRTSGGLEVRVGKSARSNDELTFKHAAPDDVWLHAQSVPGSHVILRWPDPEGAPPARDLEEAATIAAVFSRARSSGLVAVDWTRRKHVRKPRGAAPGSVVPQRVKTLFVEPLEAVADRLRSD